MLSLHWPHFRRKNNCSALKFFYMNARLIPEVIARTTMLFVSIFGAAFSKLTAVQQVEYAFLLFFLGTLATCT
jgi:hypothetical protein